MSKVKSSSKSSSKSKPRVKNNAAKPKPGKKGKTTSSLAPAKVTKQGTKTTQTRVKVGGNKRAAAAAPKRVNTKPSNKPRGQNGSKTKNSTSGAKSAQIRTQNTSTVAASGGTDGTSIVTSPQSGRALAKYRSLQKSQKSQKKLKSGTDPNQTSSSRTKASNGKNGNNGSKGSKAGNSSKNTKMSKSEEEYRNQRKKHKAIQRQRKGSRHDAEQRHRRKKSSGHKRKHSKHNKHHKKKSSKHASMSNVSNMTQMSQMSQMSMSNMSQSSANDATSPNGQVPNMPQTPNNSSVPGANSSNGSNSVDAEHARYPSRQGSMTSANGLILLSPKMVSMSNMSNISSISNISNNSSSSNSSSGSSGRQSRHVKWSETLKFRARVSNSLARRESLDVSVGSISSPKSVMSIKQRMAMLDAAREAANAPSEDDIGARGDNIKQFGVDPMDSSKKAKIAGLFERRILEQKGGNYNNHTGIGTDAAGGDIHKIIKNKITDKRDRALVAANETNGGTAGAIGTSAARAVSDESELGRERAYQRLREILKAGDVKEKVLGHEASLLLGELGFYTKPNLAGNSFLQQQQQRMEGKLVALNMNNNGALERYSASDRENFENLIIVSLIEKRELVCQVLMCNCKLRDEFLFKILCCLESSLFQKSDQQDSEQLESLRMRKEEIARVTELWFESNAIGESGMLLLAQFVEQDKNIRVIKLMNNKITNISTQTLNMMIDAIEKNTTLVKFAYDGFRFSHQKDRLEKYMKRNNDIARKERYKHLRMKSSNKLLIK